MLSIEQQDRFLAKVEKTDFCWLWIACTSSAGYGQIRINGQLFYAHRISYELENGPISDGLELDHVCRTPACVNPYPDHLEAVTHQENLLRGIGIAAKNARVTHCPQGHPYTGDNLYLAPGGGRKCKTCQREHLRAHRRRQRCLRQ